jgi:hypothetical protein
MIYKLDGTIISITDYRSFNMYQDRNPETQQPFKTVDESIKWASSITADYLAPEAITPSIALKDKAGNVIEKGKYDEEFSLCVTLPVEGFNGKSEIDIVSEDDSREILKVSFENSVGICELMTEQPCIKTIQFNAMITSEEKSYFVFQKPDQFPIEII